ncbi:MAG: hypothetical protein WA004_11735 [Saprospiraceae bacterium]
MNNHSNSTTSPSQEYIDGLKEDLDKAKNCLDEAMAEATKAKAEYQNSEAWKIFLEHFFNRISQTLDIARNVIIALEGAHGQAEIICTNIKCTVEALQILVGEVKETSECVEELKQLLKELIEKIDCINDPVLDPNVSILKCIMELKAAVDTAMDATLNSISASLHAVKLLNKLLWMICEEDLGGSPIQGGLIHNLEGLIKLVQCGELPDEYLPPQIVAPGLNPAGQAGGKIVAKGVKAPADDCDSAAAASMKNCVISPKPCLCVPPPDGCSNPDCSTESYYNSLLADFENAKALYKYKKCIWEKADEARIKAQSHYDALFKALEAAKAAKAC